ncbi:conjugal transfer protein TraH [Agrobacterium sp. DSM 25558]|uniref:conjugal transfer protein TraH n=1 Tax=Agrobacterium sp. DSM 25558 TaxID=1907665 RepID=UPI0009725262|nr:conjugal transfer protein TraH [Agrobacterium sp. DSM 25558]SCX22930.1 conjugal transfer protein TraH [Agrobacterium sp. DSM 25558]
MIDAAFIKQCADPTLSVEIVQQFVQEIGVTDPHQVTVKSGNRTFAVPTPKTAEEAMDLTKQYLGQAVVRVGLTQYPAGFGIQSADELSMNLFEPCENLRMGTALFSKVYRIVSKWYGNPRPEAFEDAMLSYASGYFEGQNVFKAEGPGDVTVWKPAPAEQLAAAQGRITGEDVPAQSSDPVSEVMAVGQDSGQKGSIEGQGASEQPLSNQDPNRAPMRINLTGIKVHNVEPGSPAK